MRLVHIDVEVCPCCGAPHYKDELEVSYWSNRREIREHCHGGKWEKRSFTCGMEIKWSPNMQRMEFGGYCSENPIYAKVMAERKAFLDSVIEHIRRKKLPVDETYREKLISELQGWSCKPDSVGGIDMWKGIKVKEG